jgi:hypothetical protein
MSNPAYDELLKDLENETSADAGFGPQVPRIKLGKDTEHTLRFLNINQLTGDLTEELTSDFYLRPGHHWVAGRTYLCKRHSTRKIGGEEDYECPICTTVNKYLAKPKHEEQARGCQVQNTFVLYALMIDKTIGGVVTDNVGKDMWTPFQVSFRKPAWEQFKAIYTRRLKRTPLSIMDLVNGSNILVKVDTRGHTVMSIIDTIPIVDGDDAAIDKAVAAIKKKTVLETFKFVSEEEEDELAEKAEEAILDGTANTYANKAGGSGASRKRRGEDGDDDAPRSSRRRASAPADDDEPTPRGTRRATPPDDDDGGDAPRGRRAPADDDEPAPARTRRAATPPADDDAPAAPTKSAPPARRAAADENEPPARRATTTPPAPPARAARPQSDVIDDDGDDVPGEHHDHAPRVGPTPDVNDDPHGEQPPDPAPPSGLNSTIKKTTQGLRRLRTQDDDDNGAT